MAKTSEKLKELVTQYEADEAKFFTGNNSAGTRARKSLQAITKLCKEGRAEIQEAKTAAVTA
jgi:hypothetical protein